MKRNQLISLLIVLSMFVMSIPRVQAATDEWVISEVDEDAFWSTYSFDDVDMVYLQGDEIRIIGWYRFEGPDVLEWGKPISEAYLSVMTTANQGTDTDASMTLYGVPARQGGALSYLDDLAQVNGPYTSSYVNVNLSSFVGNGVWHNITVTNIVREITQGYYFYSGHDIAFVTLSADNQDNERSIASEETGNGAILYVHYETPDPPSGLPPDAEWREDYRNYTIWFIPGDEGEMEYVWTSFTDPGFLLTYDDFSGNGPYTIDAVSNAQGSFAGSQRKLVRTSDDILYVVYWASNRVRVMHSIDEGATWLDETVISQAQTCIYPSIAIDSNDILHVVYQNNAEDAIYYVNYTGSWSTPLAISTGPGVGWEHEKPSIAIDGNGTLHVAYSGESVAHAFFKIWYVNYTDSWSTPLLISSDPSMHIYDQEYPAIATDSLNHVHISWMGGNASGTLKVWHRERTTNWGNITLLSTHYATFPSLAIDPDDYPHITWDGDGPGETNDQIWENNYNGTAWQGPLEISTKAGMDTRNQNHPSITINSAGIRYIAWQGTSTGVGGGEIWLSTYNNSWNTPVEIQDIAVGEYAPNLKYPYDVKTGVLIVTDENGTVIPTWNGENFTDIDDLKDFMDEDIIGYPDPENPSPPGWDVPGEGLITRFNFKLLLFVIGMILFIGTPVWGFASRPDAATWIAIMMSMLCGVALLWSLQIM